MLFEVKRVKIIVLIIVSVLYHFPINGDHTVIPVPPNYSCRIMLAFCNNSHTPVRVAIHKVGIYRDHDELVDQPEERIFVLPFPSPNHDITFADHPTVYTSCRRGEPFNYEVSIEGYGGGPLVYFDNLRLAYINEPRQVSTEVDYSRWKKNFFMTSRRDYRDYGDVQIDITILPDFVNTR